jgi:hypothetical protein
VTTCRLSGDWQEEHVYVNIERVRGKDKTLITQSAENMTCARRTDLVAGWVTTADSDVVLLLVDTDPAHARRVPVTL